MKLFAAKEILEDIGDIAVAIKRVTRESGDSEVRDLVLNLQNSVADLRIQIVEFREENLQLREEVLRLKEQRKKIAGKPKVSEEAYVFEDEAEGNFYCTRCFDSSGDKILLKPEFSIKGYKDTPEIYGEALNRFCPLCRTAHYTEFYYRTVGKIKEEVDS